MLAIKAHVPSAGVLVRRLGTVAFLPYVRVVLNLELLQVDLHSAKVVAGKTSHIDAKPGQLVKRLDSVRHHPHKVVSAGLFTARLAGCQV